jgi:hypothetical protein
MPLIAVRNAGASSLYTEAVSGSDLSEDDALDLKSALDQDKALLEAMKSAMAAARAQGLDAFAPRGDWLDIPAGMSATQAEAIFTTRMDRSFNGAAMSLSDWNNAIAQLERYVGTAQSTLPPSLGGGIVNMNGIWYVNGHAFTLSELFLANRVNTYAEMDRLLTQSLNVIAANNEVVHAMTGGMKYLSSQLQTWVGSGNDNSASSDEKKTAFDLLAEGLFTSSESTGGKAPASWTSVFAKFITWASDTYGSDSQAKRLTNQLTASGLTSISFNRLDALKLRDEMQAYLDSKTSDNQVAQMRTEAIFTSRANLLEGMSAFMKGQQNSASSVARNV